MNQDKPLIGRVRLENGIEIEIHADNTGAYAQEPDGTRYPLEMGNVQADQLAHYTQDYGFSIRGTAPDNTKVESFQMVPRIAALAIGVLPRNMPSPEEFCEDLREVDDEWMNAAPPPESSGRQVFKSVANGKHRRRKRR